MKILILGGSKFMGLNLIEKFLQFEKIEKMKIYIVNRGRIYWDGLFYEIIKNYQNNKNENISIEHFKVDRENKEEFSKIINQIISDKTENNYDNENGEIDYIIDFSCFKKKNAKFLFNSLNFSFKNYILISTDSTYNVSPIATERNVEYFLNNKNKNLELITEDYAIMSDDEIIRKKLKQKDDYGYNKFKSEIEIKKYFEENKLEEKGKKYIFLRLPDVIGSYDESYRIWYYIEWIKNSQIKPIELENVDLIRKLSFVCKDDVTDLIIKLIFNNNLEKECLDDSIWNQEYNIGCEENLTLAEIIEYIANNLGLQDKYKVDIVDYSAHTYYPSVTMGAVNINKAKKYLKFTPRSLYEGLDQEINFFKNIGNNQFKKEYQEMVDDLPEPIKNILK